MVLKDSNGPGFMPRLSPYCFVFLFIKFENMMAEKVSVYKLISKKLVVSFV